ncbi:ELWxxDGT repeat protein, partial [Pyxidicoccus fallax]|nr:hyalin [Pyxidicoccus fallax]
MTGDEMWQTDGTPAGTSLVMDLAPGPDSSLTSNFVEVGGSLYFTARQGDADSEALWKSDGTMAGTVRLKSALLPGWADAYEVDELTRVGTGLFFSAHFDDSGKELWKSDGTSAGTVRVKDLHPGPQGSNPRNFRAAGSTLFFLADSGGGDALWKSDGSEAGTVALHQFTVDGWWPSLEVVGNTAFLLLPKEGHTELWRSDGTAAGTVKLTDLPGSETWEALPCGGRLYVWNTRGLWTSDGTPGGTRALESFTSVNGDIVELGGAALFFGNTQNRSGLWRSDGTDAGTTPVDVEGLFGEAFFSNASTGSVAFFFRYESEDVALWKTDGTAGGT